MLYLIMVTRQRIFPIFILWFFLKSIVESVEDMACLGPVDPAAIFVSGNGWHKYYVLKNILRQFGTAF
jgi:hypothetical protein